MYDVAIIGGGIVGAATAHALLDRRPGLKVAVIEKEATLGAHQTGRNSGVLHSGVYYQPGSARAINCRRGLAMMIEFCDREEIPWERCGKVIVATEDDELPRLEKIRDNGRANGVEVHEIGPERLAEIEPHATGLAALHVPEAGIVDFKVVLDRLGQRIGDRGGEVVTGTRVRGAARDGDAWVLKTGDTEVRARVLVGCAGLHSDRVARSAGEDPGVRIVPFRGEYYEFAPDSPRLCRHLIYPVPDPAFPFLGVHLTRTIGGKIEVGPNAVLAFSREGYTKLSISIADLAGTLTYSGFLRLAARHWRAGAFEMWRSISKRAFVGALQRLVPTVRSEHLRKAPAGVRAQAISPDGRMVDDFLIEETERIVHVCNAPSPAATASLNIGAALADRLL